MKKFRTCRDAWIEEVEILRETAQSVYFASDWACYYNGRPEAKRSDHGYNYFDTWREAKAFLIDTLRRYHAMPSQNGGGKQMRCPTCDTVLYLRDFPGYMDKLLYCDKCYAYWPKVGSGKEIDKLHKQISDLKADREKLAERLNSAEAQIIQYDEMAALFKREHDVQISALKAALVEERALTLTWCDDPSTVGDDYSEPSRIMAIGELADEMPEIDWSDMK